jgi:hypothetical protein
MSTTPGSTSNVQALIRVGSDVLAAIATFLPSDQNVMDFFICSSIMFQTKFLNKVVLRKMYTQQDCNSFPDLNNRLTQIRSWMGVKNEPIARMLPSLQSLTFGYNFNENIDNLLLPSSLQQLTFGNDFNQSVDNLKLPVSLKQLTFGHDFNQRIDHLKLPASLEQLTFGYCFDQPVDNLPSLLQQLSFGAKFDQLVVNLHLPPSLRRLTFGDSSLPTFSACFAACFNEEGVRECGDDVQLLTFEIHFNGQTMNEPVILQHLTFTLDLNNICNYDNIPIHDPLLFNQVELSVEFSVEFNPRVDNNNVQLPSLLQQLLFGECFDSHYHPRVRVTMINNKKI